MRKRILAVLLILVFIFSMTGCTKDSKTTNGKSNYGSDKTGSKAEENAGRYIEKDIELPIQNVSVKIIKILHNKQQQFEVYTQDSSSGTYTRYIQQTDNTWKKATADWMNSENLKQMSLQDIFQGEDGIYYASLIEWSSGKAILVRASEDGKTCKKLVMPYFDEKFKATDNTKHYAYIDKIKALANGELVLHNTYNYSGLIVMSAEGKKINTIDTDQPENYLVTGNNVYGMDTQGKIFCYDATSDKIVDTYDFDGNKSNKLYAVKEDGTIFVGDTDGIHRLSPKGTLWETTMDGASSSMGQPSVRMDSLYVTDDNSLENYYVVFQDPDGSYQLKQYSFDNNVASIPEQKLTIYSLQENKTIRQAISLYSEKVPDVKIDYEVGMGKEGGNVTDYIRSLNTELLSGDGADILILDGLPVASYIDKGVLEDISGIIGKPYQDGSLVTNIIKPYYRKGKTFYAPVRFSIPLRMGSEEALKASQKLSDIDAYLNKSTKPFIPATSYAALLRNNLATYYDDLLTNGMLDEAKLKVFLETTKKLAVNSKSTIDLMIGIGTQDNSGNLVILTNNDLFGNNMGLQEPCDIMTIQINNVNDVVIPNEFISEKKYKFDTLENKFIPKCMVGLNSASKDKEAARAFLGFLYTSAVQDANLNDGFPVDASSLKKWFDEEKANWCSSYSDHEGNMLSASWPTKKDRMSYLGEIEKANKPIEINQVLYEMIIKSGVPYLSGETDIDETTAEIMSKVNTYLAE